MAARHHRYVGHHVYYTSPFGSASAWMARAEAERRLAEDDGLYLELSSLDVLSLAQVGHGPPRIEEIEP